MTEAFRNELILKLTDVMDKGTRIPLQFTDRMRQGGTTFAYEFTNPQTGETFFLKMTEKSAVSDDEVKALMKVYQIFKNEILSEPDPDRRMNYIPVPRVLASTPDRFNESFASAAKEGNYDVQIQTGAFGTHCGESLPDNLEDRLNILTDFAKLLRACAKNKIAYIDVKPLEHLFWSKKDGTLQITLIDWGNARTAAGAVLLADDIRKFCQFMPEIIYGKKMLDLQNKGRLEYPIQAEKNPVLIELLGFCSCCGELPPMNMDYAALLGDLLTGNANEFRLQNRCLTVWDAILTSIEKARQQLSAGSITAVPCEMLEKQAETMIDADRGLFQEKDSLTILKPRMTSLTSYRAWLIPAIRITQTWYSRIDLVPHNEFAVLIESIEQKKMDSVNEFFSQINDLICKKMAQSASFPELRERLTGSLNVIQDVISAWQTIEKFRNGNLSDEIFMKEFNHSQLRVIDPALSEVYQQIRKKQSAQVEIINNDQEMKGKMEMKNDTPQADHPQLSSNLQVFQQLNTAIESSGSFTALIGTDYFRRLNDAFNVVSRTPGMEKDKAVRSLLEQILAAVRLWITAVSPEKLFVPNETLGQVDWIQNLSPVVFFTPFYPVDVQTDDKDTESLGMILGREFDSLFQSLYLALAKEQSVGRPTETLAKFIQIKNLRKRLDTENLNTLRGMIDRGEFDSANQIINLHYTEYPYIFDQLNNEILVKKKEMEDQKTMLVINAVLNDLSQGENRFESGRFLNNRQNAAIVNDRFNEFRKRVTQMFELQDDVGRTKKIVTDSQHSQHSLKYLSIGILIAGIVTLIFSIALIATILIKNFRLEQSISEVGNAVSGIQATADIRETFAIETMMSKPTETPFVPTETPIPTQTVAAAAEEPLPMIEHQETESTEVPAADRFLSATIGMDITFTMPGSEIIYSSSELTDELGVVTNFAQGVPGKLIAYTDKAVQIEATFNIGRNQILTGNRATVNSQTYIRKYSNPASETSQVFLLRSQTTLIEPIEECPEGQAFCHGTISMWFDRKKIEPTIN